MQTVRQHPDTHARQEKEKVLLGYMQDALVACSPGARQKCQSSAMPDLRQGVRNRPCAEVLQSFLLRQRTVRRLHQFECRQRVLEYADQLTVDFQCDSQRVRTFNLRKPSEGNGLLPITDGQRVNQGFQRLL